MKSFSITVLLASATLIMGGRLEWFGEFEDAGCVDKYPTKECKEHAAIEGYCDDHKEFMETRCAKSCGFCQPQVPLGPGIECKDKIEGCAEHAAIEDYCKYNEEFMIKYCRKTCGLCRQPNAPGKELFWETTPWGECKQGVQRRGVKCIHVYEGKDYQVDLKYCRDNLTDEAEPADKRDCVA
ncbi:Hypothetical predicted protein [Paramuricea clavata]|uniref:Uncharacterized protein n=1 Tax=Paramuricea clavata TaxID=317549 RepID=A0A6S7INF4_PARCT|nr:Hypothetical predicted protein [Paramuricea clavata]